jgi:alkylation response protein AidB-like acyl-CoA dehydrogenase
VRFAFSDDQLAIADAVGTFLDDAASSAATRKAMVNGGLDHELWRGLSADIGLTGLLAPESHGGSALGMVEATMVGEALGRHVAAVPYAASAVVATRALATGGTQAQRDRWLPGLAAGEVIASFATGAIVDDDGTLYGRSGFVPHGAAAQLFLAPTERGIYLVPADADGVTVTPQLSLDQTRPLAAVSFAGVAAEVLPDLAWAELEPLAWTAIAADALGGAQACLDMTVAYVAERRQFGRPVGSFQAVKHKLADMAVAIEQARSAVYWAAGEIDADGAETRFAAHAAKSFACDTYTQCAGGAIQLHGGIGFTWEHDAHLYFKRARADASLLGLPTWHREQIAQLMGLAACN